MPDFFYLTEPKFSTGRDEDLDEISSLKAIRPWINLLRDVSDINKESESGEILYFVQKADEDKVAKPFRLDLSIDASFFEIDVPESIGDFAELLIGSDINGLHFEEKRSLFKLALVGLLNKLKVESPSANLFYLLMCNLDRLRGSYMEHFEVFVHNFALSEFHHKIEEKYFDYVEKIQTVLSDIQSKVYAIPAVLIGMAALTRFKTIDAYVLIILGVFFTCLLTHWMLMDQFSRLDKIKESMLFVFRSLERRSGEEPNHDEVMQDITRMRQDILIQIGRRKSRLGRYVVICWSLLIIAIISMLVEHGNVIFLEVVGVLIDKK